MFSYTVLPSGWDTSPDLLLGLVLIPLPTWTYTTAVHTWSHFTTPDARDLFLLVDDTGAYAVYELAPQPGNSSGILMLLPSDNATFPVASAVAWIGGESPTPAVSGPGVISVAAAVFSVDSILSLQFFAVTNNGSGKDTFVLAPLSRVLALTTEGAWLPDSVRVDISATPRDTTGALCGGVVSSSTPVLIVSVVGSSPVPQKTFLHLLCFDLAYNLLSPQALPPLLVSVGVSPSVSLGTSNILSIVSANSYCYNSANHNRQAGPPPCDALPTPTSGVLTYAVGSLENWVVTVLATPPTYPLSSPLNACHPTLSVGMYDMGSTPAVWVMSSGVTGLPRVVAVHRGTEKNMTDVGACGLALPHSGLVLDSWLVSV